MHVSLVVIWLRLPVSQPKKAYKKQAYCPRARKYLLINHLRPRARILFSVIGLKSFMSPKASIFALSSRFVALTSSLFTCLTLDARREG
jgi:hypothetical protein